MRKASALFLGLSLALLSLSGCKNSSEDTAYDQVGDVRVFDSPRREASLRNGSTLWNESVPAPRPLTGAMASRNAVPSKHGGQAISRQFVRVGDMELE